MKDVQPHPTSDGGLYLLGLELPAPTRLQAGRLARADLGPGAFIYVGRARRNLSGRLRRHLGRSVRVFWHIDYLRPESRLRRIWVSLGFFDECRAVQMILRQHHGSCIPIPGFGASDCRCVGHLVRLPAGFDFALDLGDRIPLSEVYRDGHPSNSHRNGSFSL